MIPEDSPEPTEEEKDGDYIMWAMCDDPHGEEGI